MLLVADADLPADTRSDDAGSLSQSSSSYSGKHFLALYVQDINDLQGSESP